jgi:hypothetical protein
MKTVDFLGIECVELTNGEITLLVTQSVGPRVISLRLGEEENLLAELPDFTLDCPGKGAYHIYGGHRLWHAPEDPARTYLPDDQPVEINEVERGVQVIQLVEVETGIQKELVIQLAPDQAVVEVEHILSNQGLWPVTCAPWAITQMKPGGVAVLPQFTGLTAGNPTLPNRTITLWQYADINSPYITWGNDCVLVRAEMNEGDLKLGFPNARGWIAYWREGTLFVKRASYNAGTDYYDFGSSSECYCNTEFLELETLGPVSVIQPGSAVSHKETWEVYANVEWPEYIADLIAIIEDK